MAERLTRAVVEQIARREARRHWGASLGLLALPALGIPTGIVGAATNPVLASTDAAGLLVGVLMTFSTVLLYLRALRRMKQRAAERILVALRDRPDAYWTYERGELVGHDARGERPRLSLDNVELAALPVARVVAISAS